jgi:ABC-type multidrug transport system ATPase subunit
MMHLHTISGFVEQDDIVIPELTVRQSLMFTAALRMGVSAGKGGQRARVEEVISELRLTKCADTLVGAAGARGISGGERSESANPCSASTHVSFRCIAASTPGSAAHSCARPLLPVAERLCIGTEVLTRPRLLFLDEPTSG